MNTSVFFMRPRAGRSNPPEQGSAYGEGFQPMLPEKKEDQTGKRVTGAISGGLSGAATGAKIGSAVPGVGNAVGAIAGGALGAVSGAAGGGDSASRLAEQYADVDTEEGLKRAKAAVKYLKGIKIG